MCPHSHWLIGQSASPSDVDSSIRSVRLPCEKGGRRVLAYPSRRRPIESIHPSMALLVRASAYSVRSCAPVRNQLSRLKVRQASPRRNTTTEANHANQSNPGNARLNAIGNALLGTALVGAGAATAFFTYLRLKNSGMGFGGVAANTIMEEGLHPAAYPWPNNHPLATFDHSRYSSA